MRRSARRVSARVSMVEPAGTLENKLLSYTSCELVSPPVFSGDYSDDH